MGTTYWSITAEGKLSISERLGFESDIKMWILHFSHLINVPITFLSLVNLSKLQTYLQDKNLRMMSKLNCSLTIQTGLSTKFHILEYWN
jgi:hypothetical protein